MHIQITSRSGLHLRGSSCFKAAQKFRIGAVPGLLLAPAERSDPNPTRYLLMAGFVLAGSATALASRGKRLRRRRHPSERSRALKKEETDLESSLNFIQGVANRVPGMIYQFRLNRDGSSCFPYASRAIEKLYGLAPEDVAQDATPVFERLHPEDQAAVAASIKHSALGLTPWKHEYRSCLPDGRVRWLQGNAAPVREANGATRWDGYIQDITEFKRIEQDQRIAATAFERHHAAMFLTDSDRLFH